MKNKVIYILIGIGLLIGIRLTSFNTIDQKTLSLIEESFEIDTNEIWRGFDLENYPVDVNYKDKEFRYFNAEILEKNPDIQILALSALNTNKGPVLKVLPEERVRKIIDVGDLSLKEREKIYKSILVHEGFHCFQMENGMEAGILVNGKIESPDENLINDLNIGKNILAKLDNDETYKKHWIQETKDLITFYESNNMDNWMESRNRRIEYEKKLLKEDYPIYEKYLNRSELIEGTARYAEEIALGLMNEEDVEIDFNGVYYTGEEKFYQSGSIKAFILDNQKDWKDINFNGSITLDELLLNT